MESEDLSSKANKDGYQSHPNDEFHYVPLPADQVSSNKAALV